MRSATHVTQADVIVPLAAITGAPRFEAEALLQDSSNVVAFRPATVFGASPRMRLDLVGMTGASGGNLAACCDFCIRVPSDQAQHVQEAHVAIGRVLCTLVEKAFQ